MLDDLLKQFQQGNRRALARLITLLSHGKCVKDILESLTPPSTSSLVIALTGSAGVGKSTLTGKLIELIRDQSLTVAVLACDPQSPLSGGSLLGDRFRMPTSPDDGIFIRSLATPGGLGAILSQLPEMIQLLRAFGFDVILIETVGAGQGDTQIHQLVDVMVLLVQPETGDELQWEKAGVLEVADVVVIHKADLPGAENTEAQINNMLTLSHQARPDVLRVSSRSIEQVKALWNVIHSRPHRDYTGNAQELLQSCIKLLTQQFHQSQQHATNEINELLQQWQSGEISRHEASVQLGRLLLNHVDDSK